MAHLAAAKINLSLGVTGRRADGYHMLESLVAFTDIGDTLSVEQAPQSRLQIDGPFAAQVSDTPQEDNLVMRALAALEAHIGRALPSSIRLNKNLPVASGMGGGSADAAAALQALCVCHGVSLAVDELAQIAAGLGADVPVCLSSEPAWMTGIGHQVTRLAPLPAADIVLVNPLKPLPTGPVFAAANIALADEDMPPRAAPPRFENLSALSGWLAAEGNDLQAAAISLMPEIADCLAALQQDDVVYCAMSGSGASCFALCAPGKGGDLAARYAQQRPDDWVQAGRLL